MGAIKFQSVILYICGMFQNVASFHGLVNDHQSAALIPYSVLPPPPQPPLLKGLSPFHSSPGTASHTRFISHLETDNQNVITVSTLGWWRGN